MNVNSNLRIAFIDIGQRYLSKGNVVEVRTSQGESVYMQVLEPSVVISKIGFGRIVERSFDARASDFDGIRIGNIVVKIEFQDPRKDAVRALPKAIYPTETKSKHDEGAFQELLKEFERLTNMSEENSRQLDLKIEEIEELKRNGRVPRKEHDEALLENENCFRDRTACRERAVHLEDKIKVLTQKLKHIQELVEKSALPMK